MAVLSRLWWISNPLFRSAGYAPVFVCIVRASCLHSSPVQWLVLSANTVQFLSSFWFIFTALCSKTKQHSNTVESVWYGQLAGKNVQTFKCWQKVWLNNCSPTAQVTMLHCSKSTTLLNTLWTLIVSSRTVNIRVRDKLIGTQYSLIIIFCD